MPHSDAGLRIEPPVSVPIAAAKKPAARPAPLPLDEPPEKCSRFHGLRAGGHGRSNDGPPTGNSWVGRVGARGPPAERVPGPAAGAGGSRGARRADADGAVRRAVTAARGRSAPPAPAAAPLTGATQC